MRRHVLLYCVDRNSRSTMIHRPGISSLPIRSVHTARPFLLWVRHVEAWLLADRERISAFLGVGTVKVPRDPETLEDPTRTLVDLARQSRRRDIREDMVPRPGSGRSVGPAYTSRMIEFAADAGRWRPEVAAENSRSLGRCRNALKRLIHGGS